MPVRMLGKRRTGAIVCPSCGRLVGAAEARCPFCGRPAPGMLGLTGALRKLEGMLGLWPVVAGGCIAVYAATLIADAAMRGDGPSFSGLLSPSANSLLAFGGSGTVPVFRFGRWWTVLSAGWLHGNLLHIALNLYGLRQLAPAIEQLYGTGRSWIIYVLSSVCGFAASTASLFMPAFVRQVLGGGAPLTVGASAALFGLLGALLHYSRRGGNRALGQQVWSWAIGNFVLGIAMRGVIDNWAHLGGFAGGWLLSYVLDPLREERLDHVALGGLCLLASLLAVVWSVVTALGLV